MKWTLREMDIITQAKWACVFSGLVWGLFWIPLRLLDSAGIDAAWATVVFYLVPLCFFLPWTRARWQRLRSCPRSFHWIGLSASCAMVLYANSMLYTEVVRGILLYYLTPIWSLILARLVLSEAITPSGILAISIGSLGLLTILEVDQGIMMPRNIGDWMGLLSGLIWAVAAVLLRRSDGGHAQEFSGLYFFYGTLVAAVLALSPVTGDIQLPSLNSVMGVLPWFIPVSILLVIPGAYAAFWGAPHLNPGIVGLLFMTEISVAAVTAALWAGEPFGGREFIGVVLMSLAGLTEVIWMRVQRLFVR